MDQSIDDDTRRATTTLGAIGSLPDVVYANPDEGIIDLLSEWLTGSCSTDFFDHEQDNNPKFAKALVDYPQLEADLPAQEAAATRKPWWKLW